MNKTFKTTITPRFHETDALKHINNAVFLNWFEQARSEIFEIFNPGQIIENWNLIIARNEVDYLMPVDLTPEVTIETYFSKIGNSSMKIEHELFQGGKKKAHGTSFMIHYNYESEKSVTINDDIRKELNKYLKEVKA